MLCIITETCEIRNESASFTFAAGERLDVAWSAADVVDDRPLEPRYSASTLIFFRLLYLFVSLSSFLWGREQGYLLSPQKLLSPDRNDLVENGLLAVSSFATRNKLSPSRRPRPWF